MKLLLDENLPHDLRLHLPGHEVFTVAYMRWGSLENGDLLATAAKDGFDAVLTKDQGIAHEQNLTNLPVAVVVIRSKSNKLVDILPAVPDLTRALANLKPKTLVIIG